jgi:hypothetical protein
MKSLKERQDERNARKAEEAAFRKASGTALPDDPDTGDEGDGDTTETPKRGKGKGVVTTADLPTDPSTGNGSGAQNPFGT